MQTQNAATKGVDQRLEVILQLFPLEKHQAICDWFNNPNNLS